MPEGDSLVNLATRLRPVLVGALLVRAAAAAAMAPATLVGLTVVSIETRGKHLLLHLSDTTTLHVHLGMTGRFFVDALDSPGLGPAPGAPQVSLHLETQTHRVLGRTVPTLERLTAARLLRHPHLASLGPDLLGERFDAAAAAARFQREPYLPLGEALLDQRLACGIGNVYKSEVLFLEALDPWRHVIDTQPATLAAVLERARGLMLRNLGPELRRTRRGLDADRYWVYERNGAPCRRCDTPIAMARQGDMGRSTYYCAACQGVTPRRTIT
jgi:endonuclease-8